LGETNSFVAKNCPPTGRRRLESARSQIRSLILQLQANEMSYIDAHTHLADPGYEGKIDELMEDAKQHDVAFLLSNSIDYESSLETLKLAKQHPGRVLAAVGVHPSTATKTDNLHLEEVKGLVEANRAHVRAVGEIGLDGTYPGDEAAKGRQKETFRFFLNLAERMRLPVTVHSRQAADETLGMLADFHIPNVLLHWYDGPVENLQPMKERGYFISVGPALLYSRRISEIATAADINMLLTETDGPVVYRGLFGDRLTEPSMVVDVVRKIAELKAMSQDAVKAAILTNFQRYMGTDR